MISYCSEIICTKINLFSCYKTRCSHVFQEVVPIKSNSIACLFWLVTNSIIWYACYLWRRSNIKGTITSPISAFTRTWSFKENIEFTYLAKHNYYSKVSLLHSFVPPLHCPWLLQSLGHILIIKVVTSRLSIWNVEFRETKFLHCPRAVLRCHWVRRLSPAICQSKRKSV